MKGLFIALLSMLAIATAFTVYMNPEKTSAIPILYWVTDNNPARTLQTKGFQEWLVKNGHPKAEMRVDSSNADSSKKIIQGVSGVAGDDIDCFTSGGELNFFVETGIVEDLTGIAAKYGFTPDKTYQAVRDDIVMDGRQYVFPCNVYTSLYFVNLDAFKKAGVEPPPVRWSFEEFEAIGKKFVAAVNDPDGLRRENFFCDSVPNIVLARSLGSDVFNETMTKASVDTKAFLKTFKLINKWTYEDHLLPTAAEQASFAVQSGYGGASAQLFNNGNYGMIFSGRHILIQFRQFGTLNLNTVEPPNGGFPNTPAGARAAFIYKGGKHKDIASLFLAYLASEEYNMNIVEDADGLPPNPVYTKTEAYLKPKGHPNEWNVHSRFANEGIDIAIVTSKSPYVSNNLAYKFFNDGFNSFMSGRLTAEEAVKDIQSRINEEIARTLLENPKLAAAYKRDLENQVKIDERLLKGERIPLSWIKNPFHRKYYKEIGLAE